MHINVNDAINFLARTPIVLNQLLNGLPESWINATEGPETWSPYDVVGHLIHGDKTDWIPRLQICLADSGDKKFEPFDRFAQFENSKGKTLQELLLEFEKVRTKNLLILRSLNLTEEDYTKTAIHPAFGQVTLAQLLATWVVHDLDHIYQISRILSSQYKDEVGPWKAYLRIVNQQV